MLDTGIQGEIERQVAGYEKHAQEEPRTFAYRVLTVLGIELKLGTVDGIEEQVIKWVGEPDMREEECIKAHDTDSDEPGDYLAPFAYDYIPSPPLPEQPPLSQEEETELLAQFPDVERDMFNLYKSIMCSSEPKRLCREDCCEILLREQD